MFDSNALNGPQMTQDQLARYLDRIRLAGPVPLTLAGLTEVQQAQRLAVNFENLDLMMGRPVSLDLEHLYDKIVVRRQGGVCAELNTLYNWLLYSLGFQVTSYNSRILTPNTYLFRRHRIMGVEIEDKTYTTDVGFADENARIPLLLEDGLIQEDGQCTYRYEWQEFYGWVQYRQLPGQDWQPILSFDLSPQVDRDFDPVLTFFACHPSSSMRDDPRVARYFPDCVMALRKHILREERRGIPVKKTELTWEEEKRVLRELFGLETEGM